MKSPEKPSEKLPQSTPADRPATATLGSLLQRAESFLQRIEAILPPPPAPPDWAAARAFRWRKGRFGVGFLQPVRQPHPIRLDDLVDITPQKERAQANTQRFVSGLPANNVLLSGARGCGKSSLVKALFNEYAAAGLRLIEVDKDDLADLPEIIDLVHARRERFLIFCDDLSFEAGDASYKALKVALDGSVAAPPENVLIYATSNRRHLMPEYFADNLAGQKHGGEIHPGEAVEEKTSLAERFGLWISFYPFSQEEYLAVAAHWLRHFGFSGDPAAPEVERDALNWALARGARNGRVAWQFARDRAERAG